MHRQKQLREQFPLWAEPVLAAVCWCCASMAMVFSSKAILSSFNWAFPATLMLFQNTTAVLVAVLLRSASLVDFEPLSWRVARRCLLLNALFVLTLLSGSWSLKLLSVPMVTVLKNAAVIGTTAGDALVHGKRVPTSTWAAVVLLLLGAVIGGRHSLAFSVSGVVWMSVFTISSAVYVVYMRVVMDRTGLSKLGMLYFNNLLSLPVLLLMVMLVDLPDVLYVDLPEPRSTFFATWILSGSLGFLLSLNSFWLISATSPTTYSIVGALKKIAQTAISMALFTPRPGEDDPLAIVVGLSGGVLYAVTKWQQAVSEERVVRSHTV